MWEQFLEGAGFISIGYILACLPRPRRHKHKVLPVPQPRCGCKHNRSFHENGTGKCSAINRWDEKTCRCKIYTGPEPMPELYAP